MANNGSTSSSLSNQILDAFEILAQAEVNSAQFDKTITGIIISCEDEATGRYKVQYQDAIFYAYSTALDVTYNKGVSVQVKIPNNDFSGRKMIIGTVEENGIDYGTLVEDPLLRYEYIGIDCIDSTAQNDLSSYWNEEKNSDIEEKGLTHFNITVYDKEKNIDLINLNEQMLSDNLKKGNSVLLGATIRTTIPDVQKFKGDYGIKYTLTFNDISNVAATVDRYYIVDIDKMSGDPYAYEEATDQIIPFDIDSDNFVYVKKIELFAKNFIYQDNTKPADVFISNLRMQVANRIPDEEFMGTALTVVMPEGNYFSKTENLTSKSAIAELRIKGKITTSTTQQIQYYWFMENLTVSKSNDIKYHKYGGRGWECLNQYNVTEGTEEEPISVDYVSATNEFKIQKSNSNAKETKYKCVVNYKGQILEKEFSFINYDIENEVIIITDRSPNFIDSIGATTLTCVATNAVSYQWAKIDAEGGFEALRDTAAENKEYENAVAKYEKLQVDIASNSEPDNKTNQELLQHYQDIIQSYNNIERRKENQIINLQANSIYQQATYKCQAFDENGISLGIGAQLVTNYASAEDTLQTGNLVINNGSQVFKYNAKGIAPTSEIFDEPQTILPLSFTLRNAQGIEIPMSALREEDVSWIVPTKDTMIQDYFGTLVSRDEETGIEIYNGKSLSYTINENYYSNKDNNEIELQVRYQDLVYIAKTNFLFTKDGDNGTNGTNYVLKILPNGEDVVGRLKMVTSNQTGTDWLRIQLWYNGIKIYEGYGDGIATTGKNIKVTWSMLGEKQGTTHNISVKNNGANPPTWSTGSGYIQDATDIVKVVVDYDEMRIVATTPIIFTPLWAPDSYRASLKEGTGFTHVVYSEDGLTPDYDSHTPFEISIHKSFLGEWGDITGHDNLYYKWSAIGNLKLKKGYTDTDSKVMFEPTGNYNSEQTNNAVLCEVLEGATWIARMHIPVHFVLNTYGHSALNEWDGNSISLDADGNTMLLAPQAGFGKKEKDNSYTGVLLGTVKDYNNDVEHTGMFGYNAGTRTMFLNSKNGSAIFGSTGSSQIVIDPTSQTAKLYSNNFYKEYDTATGLPSTYAKSNENGQGAMIDLTTPEIRWGSGNFVVDNSGHITAKGGGTIAGWYIDDHNLWSGNENKNNADTIRFGNEDFTRAINGNDRTGLRLALGKKFAVSKDGTMYAGDAIIGTGSSKITIGKSSAATNNSAIYSGKKSAFNANADGFYIGTDGIALGSFNSNGESKFQVTNGGILTSREGTIGGWTITRNTLTSKNLTMNSNGSMSGGSTYEWSIGTDGTATFKRIVANTGGTIGGWTIGSTYLRGAADSSGRYIQINSNGSINSSNNYWSIARDGTATFKRIRIDATGDSNSANAILMNVNGKFVVKGDGSITATNATIKGKITATEGKIAGYTISGDTLYGSQVGMDAESGGHYAFWAGADVNNSSSAPFRVGHDGSLVASNASITGTINATSGTFSNITVNNNCVIPASTITGVLSTSNIPSISANKISGGTISGNMISGGTITGTTISGVTIKGGTITGGEFVIDGESSITDSLLFTSVDSASIGISGKGQTLGGIALTYFHLKLGGRTIKLRFKHGMLVEGWTASGADVLNYTNTW